jgi:hypothetical protein
MLSMVSRVHLRPVARMKNVAQRGKPQIEKWRFL